MIFFSTNALIIDEETRYLQTLPMDDRLMFMNPMMKGFCHRSHTMINFQENLLFNDDFYYVINDLIIGEETRYL